MLIRKSAPTCRFPAHSFVLYESATIWRPHEKARIATDPFAAPLARLGACANEAAHALSCDGGGSSDTVLPTQKRRSRWARTAGATVHFPPTPKCSCSASMATRPGPGAGTASCALSNVHGQAGFGDAEFWNPQAARAELLQPRQRCAACCRSTCSAPAWALAGIGREQMIEKARVAFASRRLYYRPPRQVSLSFIAVEAGLSQRRLGWTLVTARDVLRPARGGRALGRGAGSLTHPRRRRQRVRADCAAYPSATLVGWLAPRRRQQPNTQHSPVSCRDGTNPCDRRRARSRHH